MAPAGDKSCARVSAVVSRCRFPTKMRAGMADLLSTDPRRAAPLVRLRTPQYPSRRAARASPAALISSANMPKWSGHGGSFASTY